MCPSRCMQSLECHRHIRRNPGSLLRRTRRRAAAYDVTEGRVEADLRRGSANLAAQAPRQVEVARQQHTARIWRPPEQRLMLVIPRKNAVSIRVQQTLDAEVAAGSEQSVRLFERRLQRRKCVAGVIGSQPCDARVAHDSTINRVPRLPCTASASRWHPCSGRHGVPLHPGSARWHWRIPGAPASAPTRSFPAQIRG